MLSDAKVIITISNVGVFYSKQLKLDVKWMQFRIYCSVEVSEWMLSDVKVMITINSACLFFSKQFKAV